jgi:cell division protein FtsX
MSEHFWYGILGAMVAGLLFVVGFLVYSIAYTNGQQSMPMACEPKCEFVYRGTKLINVTCPDSLGRMP